ncbi:hypothetical protein J2Z21_004970 [Streptomyces griseochromogenes]|uniref:Uncharacterized protein n=1 Tax=Streptomyces griseochromogenes TaxID=68214 RepID=A0A1B1ASR5_9ACTN|nr:hypothetical protein [Streptomyces griseochromogenes]ANP49562.1 hypothetical protein AVL59_08045 [Streptomyces griseochromogenes]MBP2051993.1 hypothetical protein [Streptomyces griseochromogenes]
MSAHDYDSQLLESVSVRRRRLRDAVLFGGLRQRRTVDERLGKAFAGVVIAAVMCAGCVGWSFVSHRVVGGTSSPYGPSATVPASPPAETPTSASSAR